MAELICVVNGGVIELDNTSSLPGRKKHPSGYKDVGVQIMYAAAEKLCNCDSGYKATHCHCWRQMIPIH